METLIIVIGIWLALSIIMTAAASLFFMGRNRNWEKEGDPELMDRHLLHQ